MTMMPKKKTKKKDPPASVKGMHDIFDEKYYQYDGFNEKASEVAMYYGFSPIETPLLEQKEVFTSGIGEGTDIVEKEMYELKTKGGDHLVLRPEGSAAIMRSYIENGMGSWPHPVMLYYKGNFFRHERTQKGRYRQFKQFGIECLGSSKSIMDAIVIHTTLTILHEIGLKDLIVDLNTIGGPDSRAKYVKELTNYYRQHLDEMPTDARKRLVSNPLRILDSKDPKMTALNEEAPESISYLNQSDRQHFKEVLEYLEELQVPYRINHRLVRGLDYYTRTVFEVFDNSPDQNEKQSEENEADIESESSAQRADPPWIALAAGGRYDSLATTLGHKKEVPSIGAAIGIDRVLLHAETKKLSPRIIKKPKVFFIQIGFEAKLKSLRIIEILRKARVPIKQTLNKDSLSAQLGLAEKLEIPYCIIFGQKECLEDTVIVRNMETHKQDTICICDLKEYLKTLK